MIGWMVNDQLAPMKGMKFLFNDLCEWVPGLADMTGGFTAYRELADRTEQTYAALQQAGAPLPGYLIRNASYFRPLNLPIPQIAFLQDVKMGPLRHWQVETCLKADLLIFNSEYTRAQYPELEGRGIVIPIGVDFEHFNPSRPLGDVGPYQVHSDQAVCFIGSWHFIKGYGLLRRLVETTPWHYVLIMKDDAVFDHPRVQCFNKIDHEALSMLVRQCKVGVCTSVSETQHLAGIEMGACGLPLVTTNVGAYFDRAEDTWGCVSEDWEFAAALGHMMAWATSTDVRSIVRQYWLNEGFDKQTCRRRWLDALRPLIGEVL